ncbi:nestin [Brachyhypopomus gauderio]|uniref:nestin n=1 Tax=Brachyhypopomus gauderio TaxID=698409 RepID=UPI0040422225
MATSSVRQPGLHAGEERYQMLELNKRLESYLGHVKLLEEENHLLWGEIQALRRSQDSGSGRQTQEENLRLARREVQAVWMEKDRAELEVSKLLEEMEELNAQRRRVKEAQTETKRRLEESRRELEDERRSQIWLTEQAAHLEQEVLLQEKVHQEDVAALRSSYAVCRPVPVVRQETQALKLQGLGEQYSQQAAQAWQEAADAYQRKVAQMEENLEQARAHMAHVTQEKREKQLQVQDLAKDLTSMNAKRELLETSVVQLRDRQHQELQYLQTQVQALEAEKVEVGVQIADLLEDRRSLLQMKMSLGLEVATYRALLDAEGMRAGQSAYRTSARTASFSDALTKPRGTHTGSQVSHQFSSLLTTTSRSLTSSKAKPMSSTPSWMPPRIPPQEIPEKTRATVEKDVCISEETGKQGGSATATPHPGSSLLFDLQDANEEVCYAAGASVSPAPPPDQSTLGEEDEVLPEGHAEATEVMYSGDESTLLSSSAGFMSSPLQTPESEYFPNLHSHTQTGKCFEDEEETEVSTEMAQISHAPTFPGDETENDPVVLEEKDAVTKTELVSDGIIEHKTQDIRTDTVSSEFIRHVETTNEVASSLFEQTTWHSTHAFNHTEKSSDILTWADEQEIVSHLPTEESLNRPDEIRKESTDKWEGIERIDVEEKTEVAGSGPGVWDEDDAVTEMHTEENRTDVWEGMERREDVEELTDVLCSGPEVWDGHDADTAPREDVNETAAVERNVEESKEAEVITGVEEDMMTMMEEDVRDENFANTGKDTMTQDSFAPEVDLHESVEHPEDTAESGLGPDGTVEHPEDTAGSGLGPDGTVEHPEDTAESGLGPDGTVEHPEDTAGSGLGPDGTVEHPEDTAGSGLGPDGPVEHPEDTAESGLGPDDKDFGLVEENAEDERRDSDDEASVNISASWRTDPGEVDSYTQENTLADTSPLIHYRSDEETDANTQISHVGVSEPSDSEEERERHDGVGQWSQTASKRFDTMEDLSEEPEMDHPDHTTPDRSIQTVEEGPEILTGTLDEADSEETVPLAAEGLESESDFVDRPVNVQMDDALVECSESDLQDNCEERSGHGEKTEEEDNHVLLVEKQKEGSSEYDPSESFSNETCEITEQKNVPAKHPGSGEDDTDNKEDPKMGSFTETESEGEGVNFESFPIVTNAPLPETFDEQALVEEPCEVEPTYLDVFLPETAMSKEHTHPQEEKKEQSDLPVFPDITDDLSSHSELSRQPDSQTNMAMLDQEESNSSGDESPNSSRCSQYLIQTGTSVQLPLAGLLEEVMNSGVGENSCEDYITPQTKQEENRGTENKAEEEDAMEDSRRHSEVKDMVQSDEGIGASDTTVEKRGVTTMDDEASDMIDIFQGKILSEDPLIKEKVDDPHGFFTSSIQDSAWSSLSFETSATNNPAEPENVSHDIHPDQSVMFEDWGEVGTLPPANGKPEQEMGISLTQSDGEKEKEEELRIPKTNQVQCADVREGEAVQSDVSTDDGDSWSSGEE